MLYSSVTISNWLEIGKLKGVTKHGPWKEQTYLGNKTHLKKYIVPKFGQRKATSLTNDEVEDAGAEWEKLVSSTMVNKGFGTLDAVYKYASRKLGVKKSPMGVERLAHRVTPEEMEAQALGGILDRGQDEPEGKTGVLRAIGAEGD